MNDQPLLAEIKEYKGNYPEDFHLENGNYINVCKICGNYFLGYKRRCVCKLCQP